MKTTGTNSANILAREKLLTALLGLLAEKPMSAITIAELTTTAEVSRMTFYRNYDSIEQVLRDHLDVIIHQYREEDCFPVDRASMKNTKYVVHFLNFMKQHGSYIRVLMKCGMGDLILNAVTDYEMRKWQCTPNDSILNCRIHLFAGGLYNLFVFWAYDNYRTPVETMADIISDFYVE